MKSVSAESPVYLLTGPVQTGKTTRLRKWCTELGAPVDGILAPVLDGRRHLMHIASGEIRDLEDLSGGAPAVRVRRYTFNADVFAWARQHLLAAAGLLTAPRGKTAGRSDGGLFDERAAPDGRRLPRWIVADEVGPLELRGEGLEPAVSAVVRAALQRFTAPTHRPVQPGGQIAAVAPGINVEPELRVVLVIREELTEEALAYLGVDAYQRFQVA